MDLIKGVITTQNLSKICLVCLEEKLPIFDVNAQIIIKGLSFTPISVKHMLEKLAIEKPSENLQEKPLKLCLGCLNQLEEGYMFLTKYEEACKRLERFIESQNQTTEVTNDVCIKKQPHYKTRRGKTVKTARIQQTAPPPSQLLHPCPICTQEFPALELREHAHTHKALKKYLSIPRESKVNPLSKFTALNHRAFTNVTLFRKPVQLHKCPYCNAEFSSDHLRSHLESHRNQCEFKCDQCSRIFKQLNHLNTHRVKHLKEFPYKCENCGKGFVIKSNYECHILTHKNEELPHECGFCLKRFSNPEHLHRHQIIHTENVSYANKYKVYKCRDCLRSFKDNQELSSHTCSKVKRLQSARVTCHICKKVLASAMALYNHKRNVHRIKHEKVLCSVCGVHVSNIYDHMMRHTGQKPFDCAQCEKKFTSKPQLKQHLLVHSGLKPYVCSVCAKAFNNLYNLQVHERIHKGDRCHVCDVCHKGFLEKSYLKKHMNVHTKL